MSIIMNTLYNYCITRQATYKMTLENLLSKARALEASEAQAL